MPVLEFYRSRGIQLDLAVEAHALLRGDAQQEIPGVSESKEEFENSKVTTVVIQDPAAAQMMGKAPGTYITIDAQGLRESDPLIHDSIAEVLAQKLAELLEIQNIPQNAHIMLVGLGNWAATPDALGPKVISRVFVTRHLHKYIPEQMGPGTRPVSALSPGVMGITGIETAEIIRGAVEKVTPACVIAIDALAASNVERICSTIQIADSGINPGSGVGNTRSALDRNSLGIPVIAIGIPTVVHAEIIMYEAFNNLRKAVPGMSRQINDATLQQTVNNMLMPFGGHLTVTPKEIDSLINNAARCVATALNQSLHPDITSENANLFLQ
ncbi:MAG TPA: GPR endopeptidase [Clostridia bacterium]|jgi:spore protease|nr:GPR endopeptidase [Clostridia bacterium]